MSNIYRWKQYFKDDAMAALNVLNKAKEAESISDKFKRPLAVGAPDPGTHPTVSLADPSGSPKKAESISDKFKRPLAVDDPDPGTHPSVSLAVPSGSPHANASAATQAQIMESQIHIDVL